MSDPVAGVQTQVEQLLMRQVATELVKSAMPDTEGAAGGAYEGMFASVLADAISEGQGAKRS